MGKVPYGVADRHVKCSGGGDVDLMKFYCTQYGTDFGRRWEHFEARPVTHTGSGFVSNVRPQIFYNRRLDEIDNPGFGPVVADTYSTVTQRSFQRYASSTGKETLPNTVHQTGSGYVREKPLHIPKHSEVNEACIGGLLSLAPVDVLPRHRPYLHKIQRKDPVEEENHGYGPGCMTTEMKSRYQGIQQMSPCVASLNDNMNNNNKEETGYTHNHHVEPVTFHPDFNYKNDYPGFLTNRPTGVSITKSHYLPYEFSKDREPLPRIAIRSDKDSGFSKSIKPDVSFGSSTAFDRADQMSADRIDKIKKQDPMEYINITHPDNRSSVGSRTLLGKQVPDRSMADLIGNESMGWKEETGYTRNCDKFIQAADNPARFITDNMIRYVDRRPTGRDREGHVWGGTLTPQPNAYTKSVSLHTGGPSYNPCAILTNLEPYQARSIQARDHFFDEHLYAGKIHNLAAPI